VRGMAAGPRLPHVLREARTPHSSVRTYWRTKNAHDGTRRSSSLRSCDRRMVDPPGGPLMPSQRQTLGPDTSATSYRSTACRIGTHHACAESSPETAPVDLPLIYEACDCLCHSTPGQPRLGSDAVSFFDVATDPVTGRRGRNGQGPRAVDRDV
jgi:hypothetical protein